MKKFDVTLRLYFNTGSFSCAVPSNGNGLVFSAGTSTFTNTCPMMVTANATASLPATTTGIAGGLFIQKPASTSLLGGINLSLSGASNSMSACRLYYPQVTLKPEKLIPYISENRNKKVVYSTILTNNFNNITSGSSFSALAQSGVTGIRGVLILPMLSSVNNGSVGSSLFSSGVTPFSQLLSPADSAPATTGPFSLINLQVTIGGQNVLQNTLNYTYENFLEQVSLYEKLNQGDIGLSCGLINQSYWENAYRAYYVDCTRANISDLLTPRNINISFTNNSLQPIDVLVFTEYFTEMVVDVETGLIQK
jgi:hypothetical protein